MGPNQLNVRFRVLRGTIDLCTLCKTSNLKSVSAQRKKAELALTPSLLRRRLFGGTMNQINELNWDEQEQLVKYLDFMSMLHMNQI